MVRRRSCVRTRNDRCGYDRRTGEPVQGRNSRRTQPARKQEGLRCGVGLRRLHLRLNRIDVERPARTGWSTAEPRSDSPTVISDSSPTVVRQADRPTGRQADRRPTGGRQFRQQVRQVLRSVTVIHCHTLSYATLTLGPDLREPSRACIMSSQPIFQP